jgi:hypothetical protein
LACSSIIEGTTMDQYAGIDVSLESASVCVVDSTGRIVREAKVACEPEALIAALFLPNGATTPRTRGDRDKVAVHAVSCEPVSVSLFIRQISGNSSQISSSSGRIPLQTGCFSNSLAADSLRTETGKVYSGSGNPK